MIGDSISDITAALAIDALAVGYANKPGKEESLRSAGAHAVVESINEITAALREHT